MPCQHSRHKSQQCKGREKDHGAIGDPFGKHGVNEAAQHVSDLQEERENRTGGRICDPFNVTDGHGNDKDPRAKATQKIGEDQKGEGAVTKQIFLFFFALCFFRFGEVLLHGDIAEGQEKGDEQHCRAENEEAQHRGIIGKAGGEKGHCGGNHDASNPHHYADEPRQLCVVRHIDDVIGHLIGQNVEYRQKNVGKNTACKNQKVFGRQGNVLKNAKKDQG